MVEFRKDYNLRIILLTISMLVLFTNTLYPSPVLKNSHFLRIPIGDKVRQRITEKYVTLKGNKSFRTSPEYKIEGGSVAEIVFETPDKSRFAKGRVVKFNPEKVAIEQVTVSEVIDLNFIEYSVSRNDPDVISGRKKLVRLPGKTPQEFLQGIDLSNTIGVFNSVHSAFWFRSDFLIVDGKFIAKPEGAGGLFEEVYKPITAPFWVMCFDEGNIGIKQIDLIDGKLDSRGKTIKNGIAGLPLVLNVDGEAKDVSGMIVGKDREPALRGGETIWKDPKNQKAAMSAVGKDKDGNIVFIHMAGDPNEHEELTFSELAGAMIELGVVEAVALGTSADVFQYLRGDGEEPGVKGKPRKDSMSGSDYGKNRPLAACIVAKAREAADRNRRDIFEILTDNYDFDLVTKWINEYPNNDREENIEDIKKFLEFLRNPDNREGDFVNKAFGDFEIIRKLHEEFDREFIDLSKPIPVAVFRENFLRNYIKGPIVADVGCGWNILGGEIIANNSYVREVIGCDLEEQRKRKLPKGVSFRLMEDPSVIPIETNSVDTVILSFTLHHIDVPIERYLHEVRRILKPGGNVLILEESFSSLIAPEYNQGKLTNLFLNLRSDKKKFLFLHFIDWFIHNFINKSRRPLVPGNNKTMEEWEEIFKVAGFKVLENRYLGFHRLGGRHPINRGFFVLEPEDESIGESIGAVKNLGDLSSI